MWPSLIFLTHLKMLHRYCSLDFLLHVSTLLSISVVKLNILNLICQGMGPLMWNLAANIKGLKERKEHIMWTSSIDTLQILSKTVGEWKMGTTEA